MRSRPRCGASTWPSSPRQPAARLSATTCPSSTVCWPIPAGEHCIYSRPRRWRRISWRSTRVTGLLNGERETSRQVDKGGNGCKSAAPPLLISSSPLLNRSLARPTTATRPRRSAPSGARRGALDPHQPGHAARRHPAATHRAGRAFSPTCAIVVVDEMHVYRGVFGSHIANVLRRLRRIARFHGSDPSSSWRRRPSPTPPSLPSGWPRRR